ncbi:zinc-ribbon domain-containing protein [uncultured Anaerococcus sp.]|uniref:zinc-ribbon domain-containing protein n=1 Tax=uncultured Anaerococcus sp. TaxID=293428 RepID=UPI002889A1AB|nr:zinc-ribbon domain-containing protein [uncultured Anaerococcus sp.]
MICKKCGHENKDEAKVCESCGASLEDYKNKENEKVKISKEESQKRSQRQRQRSKDKDLMTYGLILGSAMAFAVIFIVLSYFFKMGAEKEMAKDTKVETSLEENKDLYDQALTTSDEIIKNKDYQKAIEILKAIPKEAGDYYKKGQDKLAEIEKNIIEDIIKAAKDEDYKEAKKLADTYADLLPESKSLAEIKEKLKSDNPSLEDLDLGKEKSADAEKKNSEEKSTEDTEKTSENKSEKADGKEARANRRALAEKYDLEELRANNSYGQDGNPSYTEVYKEADFLNKDLKIDANMGEVRTEPNLDSGVAGYVNNGDKVHCEEVINDGGRYWLKIEGGWISSKLITGEFR